MSSDTYTVAVRELCEFAAKSGDLDLRFTPAPTAQQGIDGHKAVVARRGAGYRAELPLSGAYKHLRLRGRADGYDPDRELLEEIKTHKGDPAQMPANHRQLHWAQAKVYGWLLCQAQGLVRLTVSLVYFEIKSQTETALSQDCSAAQLQAFGEALCEHFLRWADREIEHRARRDLALTALQFPHGSFRDGQRALAKAVFNAARSGRCLMAQAPTGIGKTIGTIFPLLKACPGERLDKVFYLSAKGSGTTLALAALATLQASETGMTLRAIELTARDKTCEHPDKSCHGDSCPLARGFYDRLPAARDAAVTIGAHVVLNKAQLREVALAHQVCSYYLGQEMVRWCDVVVGDYNYYFDAGALLYSLALSNQWRAAVLVDEAHNLLERARTMYSAKLAYSQLRTLRKGLIPAAVKKPLERLSKVWKQLAKAHAEPYQVLPKPPGPLASALLDVVAAITEIVTQDPRAERGALLDFYFDALQFTRLLESFGEHSIFDISRTGAAGPRVAGAPACAPGSSHAQTDSTLCIRNVVPAPFLKARFAQARASVLFSATLAPMDFYVDTLGLATDTAWIDVEAPFKAEQLSVRVVRSVSTRYRQRVTSIEPITRLIAEQYETQPGNYLAFFSSYEYLDQVAERFTALHPAIPSWTQTRGMGQTDRDGFLARFTPDGNGVGFAVLGGLFAEGIDLPGTCLIGAIIATLGLPQFNPINEEMRRRMDTAFGRGHDYTYLFPGIRKVVQAAGRVIRTPSDRGSILLIDDRFSQPQVLCLLPPWWQVEFRSADCA